MSNFPGVGQAPKNPRGSPRLGLSMNFVPWGENSPDHRGSRFSGLGMNFVLLGTSPQTPRLASLGPWCVEVEIRQKRICSSRDFFNVWLYESKNAESQECKTIRRPSEATHRWPQGRMPYEGRVKLISRVKTALVLWG
jgi:hypothetical protein